MRGAHGPGRTLGFSVSPPQRPRKGLELRARKRALGRLGSNLKVSALRSKLFRARALEPGSET